MVTSWAQHLECFANRYVVVTGAAGGIGWTVAEAFAATGAAVIAVDRTLGLAEEASAGLGRSGDHNHVPVGIDFMSTESVKLGLARIREVSKDIAALVNVAGIAEDALVHMVSQDALRRHLQVNFESHIQVTQYVSRLMQRSGGGAIVNVSSVTALDGNPGQLAYGSSKAALTTATRILSMELAPMNIRVNAVAPGVIDTEMSRSLSEVAREKLMSRVSMRRIGQPQEVANAILWLCSPAAAYVTGQTLRIDGGM